MTDETHVAEASAQPDPDPNHAESNHASGSSAAEAEVHAEAGQVEAGRSGVAGEQEPGELAGGRVESVVGQGEHEAAAAGAGDSVDGGVEQTEIEVEAEEVVDDATMRRAVEAILMVTDEPLPAMTLARAVGRATGDVAETLASLAAEYAEHGRGFELREVAGGWRYYTREDAAPYVERFVLDGQQARLTQAALETLSVIAYKQPVSRARVSAIRGVNVDGVVRTLVTRGLVEEAGTDTESQATLYRTTSYFLERMGMQSLEDLPELAPYLPDMDDIEDELTPQTTPDANHDAQPQGGAEWEGGETRPEVEAEVAETGEGAPVAGGGESARSDE